MSKLMLDVDQAGELKAAFRREGSWTNEEIKMLCEQKGFLKQVREALLGNTEIKAPVPANLLQLVTTVSVPAIGGFSATENFRVDTKKVATRIYYIGENFKNHFGQKVEGASGATEIKIHKLTKSSLDAPIMTELADKREITLGQFFSLLSKQGKGEAGVLLVNGWSNIAYIRDDEKVLWAVLTRWRADDGGCYIGASSVGRPGRWRGGTQVLSR